jgi:lipopolysaccharide export system protein LptA
MHRQKSSLAAGGAVAAALIVLSGGATAQVSAHGDPLDISGEHSEYFAKEHMTLVTGRVEVLQGQNRLRTNTLRVWHAAKGAKASTPGGGLLGGDDIERIEASGDVYLVTPTEVVKGDKAVYTAADDTTVVTGKVVLTQGENVATGRRLTFDNRTGHSTLDAGDGGRVRFTLYPNNAKTTEAAR